MNIEEAVGAELKACRRKKQISQEQLAFDAGVHRTYVSLIERAAKSPILGVLFWLCHALDVSPLTSGIDSEYVPRYCRFTRIYSYMIWIYTDSRSPPESSDLDY